MNKNTVIKRVLIASAAVACLDGTAGAATIFTEDFNTFGGSVNNTQSGTGYHFDGPVTFADWVDTGFNAAHVVDLSHPADTNYAAMIFAGRTGQPASEANVLTQAAGIAANDSGTNYDISFLIGPTVGGGAGSATIAADGLVIDVLRGDDSVLATYTSQPGAWGGGPAHPMSPDSFSYIGDGTGDVRIRIRSLLTNVQRHSGAIDDLVVSSTPIPEPSSAALLGLGGIALLLRRRK